jgi:hypothetical protein
VVSRALPRLPIGAPTPTGPRAPRELVTRHRGWRRSQGNSTHRGAGASPDCCPWSLSGGSSLVSGPASSRRSFAAPTTPAGTGARQQTQHASCHGSGSQSSAVARSAVSSLPGGALQPPPRQYRFTAFRPVAHPLREEDRRRRRPWRAIGRGRCGGRAPSVPRAQLPSRRRRREPGWPRPRCGVVPPGRRGLLRRGGRRGV